MVPSVLTSALRVLAIVLASLALGVRAPAPISAVVHQGSSIRRAIEREQSYRPARSEQPTIERGSASEADRSRADAHGTFAILPPAFVVTPALALVDLEAPSETHELPHTAVPTPPRARAPPVG